MTIVKSLKALSAKPGIVAVIASRHDLVRAARLRRLPDFFEVRLDALYPVTRAMENTLGQLRAPLILTARHPLEGGANQLSQRQRRDLLRAYLPLAAGIDVELRSGEAMRQFLEDAKTHRAQRIISIHDFNKMPATPQLAEWMESALRLRADIFKLAVRTETAADLSRLVDFFEQYRRRLPISAMGVGKLGRRSRLELARRGSVLNYAHLGSARVEGQLSLTDLRRVFHRA